MTKLLNVVRDASVSAQIAFAGAFTEMDRDLLRMTRDRAWRRSQKAKHGRKR